MQQTLLLDSRRIEFGLWLAAAVFFCLFVMFPGTSLAQDVLESIQFDATLSWPDSSPDNLKHADGTLFFAAGNVLVLLDSRTLDEQSRIPLDAPTGIQGLAVDPADDVVYAACGRGGLQVVDISDKSSPSLAASLVEYDGANRVIATALDLDPTATYLYIADNFFGMHIVNISKPKEPEYITGYEQSSPYSQEEAAEQASSGGYINIYTRSVNDKKLAFILDRYFGLRILDISEIYGIEELDQFDMRSDAYFGQLSGVVDITANDDYAFVADSAFGIAILDYYTGQEVKINEDAVGQIEAPGRAFGLALSGDGNRLFLADRDAGLLVADISEPYPDYRANPDHPAELVNKESYAAAGAYAVLESGGDVFLANAENGLARLETVIGTLDYLETENFFDPPADATSLAIEGEYAYVLDNASAAEGLRIIELKDENTGRSRMAGFLETPGEAFSVAVQESFAWIADGTEGVACVDIADPEHADLIENLSFDYPDDARDIKLMEDEQGSIYAFIADSGGTQPSLIIAEVNSQGGLEFTSSVAINGARAVEIYEEETREGETANRFALVANTTGFTVVDVSDPSDPVEKGSLDTSSNGGQALDIAAKPPYVLVANGSRGVLLVDLSDPAKPEQIDSFESDGTAEALFVQQSYVHTAVGEEGLLVLGISDTEPAELTPIDIDPAEDVESAYYDTPGYAVDVCVAGGATSYTYIADTHGGFLTFLQSDRIGGGINEQPFEESPDDTGCFIEVLTLGY